MLGWIWMLRREVRGKKRPGGGLRWGKRRGEGKGRKEGKGGVLWRMR